MQVIIYVAILFAFVSDSLASPGVEASRVLVIEQARKSIGIRELSERNDGPMVDEILSSVNLEGSKAPWCAAFIVWVGDKAFGSTLLNPYPRSAWSPTFLAKPTWDRQRKGTPLKPADVFGIWFNSMGRVAHVGFVEKSEGDWLVTIEGNTNGGGSRDGDGVYRRRRLSTNVLGRGWL
jgi:hypothetical protein